jgi:16S rRNA (cytosine967-C5)-methyltransferase
VTARPARGSRREASPARATAARVLARVERDAAWADLALDAELARRPLAPRDRALATELVYGTLRWQRYLDWILSPHARRPLDTLDLEARLLLRLTAYQIAFLERVPAFAAVNDAVTLAGRLRPGTAGFVNAVLRAFARRGAREREPAPPPDPEEALAVRHSFPTWLARRWVEREGPEAAAALMQALTRRPPLTVRTNTLRLDREALARRLREEEGLNARPTRHAPEGLVVDHGGPPGAWGAFAAGLCLVQDEAAMLVAHLLDPRPDETVADVCAAPGTKTTHLAQLMRDRGRIWASDPQPGRLARVRESAARLGLGSIECLEGAVERVAPARAGRCDRVLVDAPCSNLGVLRRTPEVKWRRTPGDLPAAAAAQTRILAAAAGMVRPGGVLVYATCSLEPEENAGVVAGFLATHPGFRLDPPPTFPVPLEADGFLRCRPDRHDTDGFTAARLRRLP